MTSLRDQAGQAALAGGIKSSFSINKSGISGTSRWDLSWSRQAKACPRAFYRTSMLELEGHPLEKSCICLRENCFLRGIFSTGLCDYFSRNPWNFKYYFLTSPPRCIHRLKVLQTEVSFSCLETGNAWPVAMHTSSVLPCGFTPTPSRRKQGWG